MSKNTELTDPPSGHSIQNGHPGGKQDPYLKRRKTGSRAFQSLVVTSTSRAAGGEDIIPTPIAMSVVQKKVGDFHFKMQQMVSALANADESLQIRDQDNFFTQFYIDKAALSRLNAISGQDGFARFGVYFGLEDPITQKPLADPKGPGLGRLTCCFVGLDDSYQVIKGHFPVTPDSLPLVNAEETWPPPPPTPPSPAEPFNLKSDVLDVHDFFDPK